jgi:hypothetical protein
MSEQRMRTARKLIRQKRYDVAREILEQMIADDPQSEDAPLAKSWLQNLEGMKPPRKKPDVNWTLISYVLGGSAAVIFVVVMAALVSGVVQKRAEDLGDIFRWQSEGEEWDYMYESLLLYCSPLISYGAETCMDWTDSLIGHPFMVEHGPYYSIVRDCLGSLDLYQEEDYNQFGRCLENAEVPPPGWW